MGTDIILQAGKRDACFGWRMLITSSSHETPGSALQSHILVGACVCVTSGIHAHPLDSEKCGTVVLVRGHVSM